MTGAVREHAAAIEFRAAGRTLRATMPYSRRARDRDELFLPGSLRPQYPVGMNLQHDRAIRLASTEDRTLRLRETDTAMIIEADLTEGPLDLVRRGRLSGISPEFIARRERRDGTTRVLAEADLYDFGLVHLGSYRTKLELRAGHLLTATIPTGHRCSCECAGRDCDSVIFDEGSLDALVDGPDDVVAHTGRLDASSILGSKAAGSLVLTRTGAGVVLTLTEAGTPAAASVRAAAAISPIHARPLVDIDASESVIEGRTRRYSAAVVTGILVKVAPPDRRDGWDPAQVAEPDPEARSVDRRLVLL